MGFVCFLVLSLFLKFIFNVFISRGNDFEKNSEYAKTWKKDDDGGVISDQPRITVGDAGMGPQGGYITRLVLF